MDQTNTVIEDLAQSALSSGSIPAVFAPQHLNGYVFMDGGTVWNTNLNSAVQQCMEIVDDYSDIIVDVAVCGYSSVHTTEETGTTMENYQTSRDINAYYSNTSSIVEQMRAFPGLQTRYYFQERNSCPGNSIFFGNSTTWCL